MSGLGIAFKAHVEVVLGAVLMRNGMLRNRCSPSVGHANRACLLFPKQNWFRRRTLTPAYRRHCKSNSGIIRRVIKADDQVRAASKVRSEAPVPLWLRSSAPSILVIGDSCRYARVQTAFEWSYQCASLPVLLGGSSSHALNARQAILRTSRCEGSMPR